LGNSASSWLLLYDCTSDADVLVLVLYYFVFETAWGWCLSAKMCRSF